MQHSDSGAAPSPATAGEEGDFSSLRAAARAGRRAGRHVALAEPGDGTAAGAAAGAADDAGPTTTATAPQQEQQSLPPPPQQPQPQVVPVKRVGFSFDGVVVGGGDGADGSQQQQQAFTGVSRRKQEQLQREEQSQAKLRSKYDERVVDALLDVPELEEAGKEDITHMVAQAPKAAAPQVQGISELEKDQAWMPAAAQASSRSTDINLSLLTSCLLPSAQVVEPPDVWDYSLLFSQLKAELQQSEGVNGGAGSSGDGANAATDDPVPA